MYNVYEKCPVLENERYLMRLVSIDDCSDLLKVYSDKKAVPLFNSDNCNGDDFYYTTEARMEQAIEFWLMEYGKRYYVRWSIIDKLRSRAIGTIELFNRTAEDYFTNCGLLRLDLSSDYENETELRNILLLIIPSSFEMFGCDMLATKAIPEAINRISVLKSLGFELSTESVIGHNGEKYGNYYTLNIV